MAVATIETLVKQALAEESEGLFEQLLCTTGKVLTLSPEHALGWTLHGKAFAGLRNYRNAAQAYARALRLLPHDARLHARFGHCLMHIGEDGYARACFRHALELDPKTTSALEGLLAYEVFAPDHPYVHELARMADAVSVSLKTRAHAAFLLGRVLLTAGRDAEAFARYRQGNDLVAKGLQADRLVDPDWHPLLAMDRKYFEQMNADCTRPPAPPCPALIVTGLPRSGKSLVEHLLAQHSAVVAGGELAGFSKFVGKRGADPLARARQLAFQADGSLARLYASAMAGLGRPGQQRVVDTSPAHLRILGFLGVLHPEVPVVLCQRDPLDLGASLYFKMFATGHFFTYDLKRLGAALAGADRLIEHWMAHLPNPVMRVRYEEMVADPDGTRLKLLQLAGLSPLPSAGSGSAGPAKVPLHSSHSHSSFARITQELVGFGRRFNRELEPMMSAYAAGRAIVFPAEKALPAI